MPYLHSIKLQVGSKSMAGPALASNTVVVHRSFHVAQESQMLMPGIGSKLMVLPGHQAHSKYQKLRLHNPLAMASSVSNLTLPKYKIDVKHRQWHEEMTRKRNLRNPVILRSFQPGFISTSLVHRRRLSVTPCCSSSSKAIIEVKDLVVPVILTMSLAMAGAYTGVCISGFISGTCTQFPCGQDNGPISIFLQVPLIGTHLLAFAMFPTSMYAFKESAPMLGSKRPFIAVIGFSFIMVAICGEIGWHIGQKWLYKEEYNILNYMFYAFMGLGTSLWAYGVQQKDRNIDGIANVLLLLAPLLMTWIYATSAAAEATPLIDLVANRDGKMPIYLILTAQYTILTWRLFEMLNYDLKAFLFPLCSVGVNLGFIFLLQENINNTFFNPLYHMLHDLLGTEMGIFIITVLVWNAAAKKDSTASFKVEADDTKLQL